MPQHMDGKRIAYRAHAIQRMFERRIAETEVARVLAAGEVIEDCPGDYPYPSHLILGWCGSRPIHVVAAENKTEGEIIVVTAYEPDEAEWQPDFKRRKQ
jgi:hypothetical protein